MKTTSKTFHSEEIMKEKERENRFFKIVFTVIIVLFTLFSVIGANAQKSNSIYFNNLNDKGVIIDGYDPVAFFTDNKPVKGDEAFQYSYENAIYYFASQEHLDLFKSNSEKSKKEIC